MIWILNWVNDLKSFSFTFQIFRPIIWALLIFDRSDFVTTLDYRLVISGRSNYHFFEIIFEISIKIRSKWYNTSLVPTIPIFHHSWPLLTTGWSSLVSSNIIFDINFEISIRFPSKWYVICPISYNLDFSTTLDHRLVISGWSKNFETTFIEFFVSTLPRKKCFCTTNGCCIEFIVLVILLYKIDSKNSKRKFSNTICIKKTWFFWQTVFCIVFYGVQSTRNQRGQKNFLDEKVC